MHRLNDRICLESQHSIYIENQHSTCQTAAESKNPACIELNDIPQIRNILVGGRTVDIEAAVFDNEAALPNFCSGLIGLRFLSQLGG